jgi:hypothetical protein
MTTAPDDSGRFDLPSEGAIVRDDRRKDGLNDELLVMSVHPDTTAADEYIPEIGQTVADVNKPYAADSPVVDVVYLEEVEDTLDGWRSIDDINEAILAGALHTYTFPADRLSRTPGGEDQ